MFFLTPRYLKHAKLLHKGVTRFIDYKRDLLPAAKLEEICGLRRSLEQAMKARDKTRLQELNEEINKVCEKALPEAAPSEIADNVEVFFVAIVIALGIRGYIAQPFQIPTGSMQPTLNGITAQATAEDPRPGLLGYLGSFLTSSRQIHVVSDHSGYLRDEEPVTEHKYWLIFMPYCKLHFKDGHTIDIMAPYSQLTNELQLAKHLRSQPVLTGNDTPDMKYRVVIQGGIKVEKGQLLASGIVQNGDHVLVDKFSYHFRSPNRGEVFVFTTKHIRGIENSSSFDPRHGSQHYIKRLAGLPGDKLEVKSPKLFINGVEAQEPGFQRVMQGTYEAPVDGYRGYSDPGAIGGGISKIDLGAEQYFAMGDNSYSSSDSRSWGSVPERNLVGSALFCYWPLTEHWGLIK
ncbi:signal peptidase I [Prosthecobacter dejongeii]|uniref:Signal peptidase I n=1 Tax=Prosthecobacter dejongeii TaxID=48465 RepID=A0A7W7YQI8_9BACT|nr:signal peptidase I [Prosthecobacter dejongeii]MBB5040372.1 signal peptidase I [Prosthecobacter dejongeii]